MAAPGNFLKVVFNYSFFQGQTASFAMWYKFAGAFGVGGAQSYLNSVINSAYTAGLNTYLKSIIASPVQLSRIDTYVYQPNAATLFDKGTKSYADVGTSGSATSPAQVAMVVSLRTAGFGRAYRGRCYVPFHNGISLATGQLTSTQKNAATAAFKAFNAVVTAGGDPVWVLNSSSRSASSPITSIIVDGVLDTQRRRTDKMSDSAPSVTSIP